MTDDSYPGELSPGEILALRERVKERLTRIPGVLSVGFGLKQVGGDLTETRALRVYVERKKSLDELTVDEMVPAEVDGVPTDVVTIPRGSSFGTRDTDRHSPLIGGITISNLKPDGSGQFGMGTLGCFATIDGVAGPKNVVLLGNAHVLAANGGAAGDTIYQPNLTGGQVDPDPKNHGPSAKNHNMGLEGPHSYTYPSESPVDYHVDCGTAKLNIDISSWCDCNCGVSYKNELREINIGGNSKLEGVARAVDGETVHKSGALTGGTTGTISDVLGSALINNPPVQVDNVILVEPTSDPAFAEEGDSGAALVNDSNELIGLVFGGADPTVSPRVAFACHIAPVLDLLEVTPISTQNPPVGPAGHARATRMARVAGPDAIGPEDHTVELQERLNRSETGQLLHRAFLDHRSEVVDLVNRHRPVTVAWHRAKGPTFFAHFVENARHPDHRIPAEVEGVTRSDLADRMGEALSAHGSERLRAAISEHRGLVMAMIEDADDLHALVAGFEESSKHG